MTTRRQVVVTSAVVGAAVGAAIFGARSQSAPIRIGEINSYSTIPQFTLPYRMGWQLAVDEVNAAGGLLGRRVEVISRDDAGKPEDAIRLATELRTNENVALITGTFLSNVGLAVADFALRNKVVFVAAEPLTDALVWEKGNRYTFRLRPSTYMQSAMLVEEAAKLPAKRWAIIAPNYEYGQSAVANFKQLMKAQAPRCRVRRRTMAGARQARGGKHRAGDYRGAARCGVQRDVRCGFAAAGARRQLARVIPACSGGQPALGRA